MAATFDGDKVALFNPDTGEFIAISEFTDIRYSIEFKTDAVNLSIIFSEGKAPIAIPDLNDSTKLPVYITYVSKEEPDPMDGHNVYLERVSFDDNFMKVETRTNVDVTKLNGGFVYSRRLFFINEGTRELYYTQTSTFKGELRVLPLEGAFTSSESEVVHGFPWPFIGDNSLDNKVVLITDGGQIGIFSGDPESDWALETIISLYSLLTKDYESLAEAEGQLYIATVNGVYLLNDVVVAARRDSNLNNIDIALTRDIESRYLELVNSGYSKFRFKYIPKIDALLLLFVNEHRGRTDILAYSIKKKAWFEWEGMPITDIEEYEGRILATGSSTLRNPKIDSDQLDESLYSTIYEVWTNNKDIQYPYRVSGAYPFIPVQDLNMDVQEITPYIYSSIVFPYKQGLSEITEIDRDLIDGVAIDTANTPAPFNQINIIEESIDPSFKLETALSLKFEFILNHSDDNRIEIHGFILKYFTASPFPGGDMGTFLKRTRG